MRKALASSDYNYYLKYTHANNYKHGAHTELIAQKLELIEQGKLKRLMVLLPPRHSKSMTVSETFPSYFIGRNKERRVIQLSYGASLAMKFGRANRNKVEKYGRELFDIEINHGNSSVTDWGIAGARGGMISAGIGGSVTGEGADLMIIDDPIKNRKEANSKTYRDSVWAEWQDTILTRLQPGGAVIVILTRWHEDDLVGRLLNPDFGEVDDWDIVSLPAIAEEDDLLGRPIGKPLWPEYGFDLEWAEKRKAAVGARTWNSLYQQRPSAQVGTIVQRHWWKYYNVIPPVADLDETLQSWDLSFKDTEAGSYVVGQIWGRKGPDRYLLDQMRAKLDFTNTLKAIRSLSAKWPDTLIKLVEDKANGPAVISTLRLEIPGIIPVQPRGSKEERAIAVSPYIESGNVYIPTPGLAAWVPDYVEEWANFPYGTDNDQVDATTQALDRMAITPKPRKNRSGKGAR